MAGLVQSQSDSVIEIGCGTGAVARAIARRPEMQGPITAVDISAHLIGKAQHLAQEAGLGGRIDFRVGDAHGLTLPEGGFDVVVMHTLVSHVAQPSDVLAEGRRLLRPGSGRLVGLTVTLPPGPSPQGPRTWARRRTGPCRGESSRSPE